MKPDVNILKYTLSSGYIVDLPDLNGSLYLDLSNIDICNDKQIPIEDAFNIIKYKDLDNKFYNLNIGIIESLDYLLSKYYVYCIGSNRSSINESNVIDSVVTYITKDTDYMDVVFNIYTIHKSEAKASNYTLSLRFFRNNNMLQKIALLSFYNSGSKDIYISNKEPDKKNPVLWINPDTSILYYYYGDRYNRITDDTKLPIEIWEKTFNISNKGIKPNDKLLIDNDISFSNSIGDLKSKGSYIRNLDDGTAELIIDDVYIKNNNIDLFNDKSIKAIHNKVFITNASCITTDVVEFDSYYRLYFINDHSFIILDQVYITDNKDYYWGLVLNISAKYIDVSKTDYSGTLKPIALCNVIQLGSRINTSRQSCFLLGIDSDGQYFNRYDGIVDYNLESKLNQKVSSNSILKGKFIIQSGTTGWENIDGLSDKINDIEYHINTLCITNLLYNSGFKGNYNFYDFTEQSTLSDNSDLYDISLYGWYYNNVVVQDNDIAISKKSIVISNGYIYQPYSYIADKQYTISFYAKGSKLSINGITIPITNDFYRYSILVNNASNIVRLEGSCEVFDIKLEYGKSPTGWTESISDDNKELLDITKYHYLLSNILDSNKEVNAIALKSLLLLGYIVDDNITTNTAVISGIVNNDSDLFIGAGGNILDIYSKLYDIESIKDFVTAILHNGQLLSNNAELYNSLFQGVFKSNNTGIRFVINDNILYGYDINNNEVFNITLSDDVIIRVNKYNNGVVVNKVEIASTGVSITNTTTNKSIVISNTDHISIKGDIPLLADATSGDICIGDDSSPLFKTLVIKK